MPNKLFNDVHAGDTSKFIDGQKGKGKVQDEGGRLTPTTPRFGTGYESNGSKDAKFGMKSPVSPRKK